MPTFVEEASRSAGPPPVKKLKQIDPYDYAKSLPAGGMTLDMLRKTRPPPRQPKNSTNNQLPLPSSVDKVEAWGTPRKSKRGGNGDRPMKVITLNDSGSKIDKRGGQWAEHRDQPKQISNNSELSLSLRSMDDTRNGTKSWEKTQHQTLASSTNLVDISKTSINTPTSSKQLTLLPSSSTKRQTTYKNSQYGGYNDEDEDGEYSQDYSNDFMQDSYHDRDKDAAAILVKQRQNKSSSVSAPNKNAVNVSSLSTLPKLSLKPTAEEKRANIPKGTIFERESPRAKSTLKSFLRNFMEDNGVDLRTDIDLEKHSLITGNPISNAWIQEICVMQNKLKSLNLANGREVTDIGLWAIARHCSGLESLNLSKCNSITKIGLRSLSLRCQKLRSINFDDCALVDDASLRTLASGLWDLRSLSLKNCSLITDQGISEIAKCCTKLQHVNVSGCSKIGEFGDKALLEVGRNCPHLRTLDMHGCEHVRDVGLKSVAKGCPHLATLRLTGCKEVTGKAVSALSKHCTGLTDLSLSGCENIGSSDISVLAQQCKGLVNLDLSGCNGIAASGVQSVVSHCRHLKRLSFENCTSIGDDSCLVLSYAHQLEYLNLSHCNAVTQRGIGELAVSCTGLDSLNITGCTQIGRRFLMETIGKMEFAQPAIGWYGYEPKEDSAELRVAKALHEKKTKAANVIQRHVRGFLGRKRANEAYRDWVIGHSLKHVQARVRGMHERKRWQRRRMAALQQRSVTAIAAAVRGFKGRSFVAQRKNNFQLLRRNEMLALLVQRVWRGYMDRVFVRVIRRELYAQQMKAARHQALMEVKARVIQSKWRSKQSSKAVGLLKAAKEAKEARFKLEQASAQQMQRVLRGHFGRQTHRRVTREFRKRLHEWRCGICIQSAFRGMLGRRRAAYMRWLAEKAHEMAMAIRIQNMWRTNRARYFTSLTRSLRELRMIEFRAARQIQRMWRGKVGRLKAQRRKQLVLELKKRERAAMEICRIYRGHKGRERWEVAFQLRRLAELAKPLYAREKYLMEEKEQVEKEAAKAQAMLEDGRKDTDSLREEMETMMTVTNKYWDTSRITGGPQRFLTEYLKVRLAEQLAEMEAKVTEDADVFNDFVVRTRKVERDLRQVRRELQPLTQGMSIKTKRDRVVRIRNKVRLEKRSAMAIQRYFRGYRLRKALFSWYRDYWVEQIDETTGAPIYYNTWSEEVKWVKPLEMTLLPHLAQPAPDKEQLAILNKGIGKGGGEEEGEEDDDDETDESGEEETDSEEEVEDEGEWAIEEGIEEPAQEIEEYYG